jgi:hypothetical protein
MTKNQVHEWHENREDGKKRYFRAHWNSRNWQFRKTEPEDEDWVAVEKPSAQLWLDLRDVLFRKYQRKRVPYKLLITVDAILESMGVSVDAQKESED